MHYACIDCCQWCGTHFTETPPVEIGEDSAGAARYEICPECAKLGVTEDDLDAWAREVVPGRYMKLIRRIKQRHATERTFAD